MQRLNLYNGVVIVPLLARLILCAAFLTAGWNKLMHTQEFTGEEARTLIERGFVEKARPVSSVRLAQQDDGRTAGEQLRDAAQDLEPPPDVIAVDPETGEQVVIAKRLHGITLALIANGIEGRWPSIMAWGLALTELVGGTLLLVGLFSRIWALGIAIIMGCAFYLTSLPQFLDLGPFGVAADMTNNYAFFHQVYAQLGLFVLAFGVLLTGPGPLSLDRLIFRAARPHDPDADLPD